MRYLKLGNTDLNVSALCVGGMSFGEHSDEFYQWTLNPEETKNMLSFAFDQGVNFIDTANQYSKGTSEEYIGKALKDLGIRREEVALATKVYYNEGHLSREAIRREIEGSLTRLQTDYVDLYQIHRFDYGTPIEETMMTLHELVKEGKVRALGASSMYGYQFHNMQLCAEKNGLTLFSTMQNHYNLLYREDERELLPICRQYGVSVLPYSPLAGGHLAHRGWESGSVRSSTDKVIRRRYDQCMENDLEIIERCAEIAEKTGMSMSQVALAWLYAKGVTAPIVGATKVHHFAEAVQAADLVLSEEDCRYLEELYRPHPLAGPIPPQK